MKPVFLVLMAMVAPVMSGFAADVPEIAGSASPDGSLHAVMDIDRDPKLDPEWKQDSYPMVEITDKRSGKVVLATGYFGEPHSDQRPLREHVSVRWRKDSRAFAITVDDRNYSHCKVFAKDAEGSFVEVKLPGYEEVTGFPTPRAEDALPRGRSIVEGWDEEGLLIYYMILNAGPQYRGKDPFEHRVLLEVSPMGMKKVRAVEIQKEDGK